jgi:hypothetical protein
MLLVSAERGRYRYSELGLRGGASSSEGKHNDRFLEYENTALQETEISKPAGTSCEQVALLSQAYRGKFVPCTIPSAPNCKVFLCGTLHVTKASADMVRDVIQRLKPDYVILELCEARIDSLCEPDENMKT